MNVNLLSDESLSYKADTLFYLTRESLKRRQIDEVYKAKAATSPKSLADAILSENVLAVIRKEVKRRSGQAVEYKEVSRLLRETVVRPECLS